MRTLNLFYWGFYTLAIGIILPVSTYINRFSTIKDSLPSFIFTSFIYLFIIISIVSIGLLLMFGDRFKFVCYLGVLIPIISLFYVLFTASISGKLFHLFTDWIPIYYFFKNLRTLKNEEEK